MPCLWILIYSESCSLKMDILFKMHGVAWQNVGMWAKLLFTVQPVGFSTKKGNFWVLQNFAGVSWRLTCGINAKYVLSLRELYL